MKILITGASGFIGRHLWGELRASQHDVIGVDYSEGDLTMPGVAHDIIGKHRPDIVIHLAAKVGRLFGEDNPMVTVSSNAIATIWVAQACTKFRARLIYGSTSEAFGDCGEDSVDESKHGVLPHNLYGLSKRWGEEAARLYAKDGLQILRFSMPYGPGLPAGQGRAAIINLLWQAHYRRLMIVHRGARRCFCWIGDLVAGIRMIMEDKGCGIWNVGRDDNEVSMLDVARMACLITKAPFELIEEVEPPPNQTVVKRLNIGRLSALGWGPQVDLLKGMNLTYEAVKLYDKNGLPPDDWSCV